MLRQIVLDTETTGLEPEKGHRVIEIGCVEIIDRQVTDNYFHVYIDPERLVDDGAFKVHGIGNEFLQGKPKFKAIVADFIRFIKDSELIIHNAAFDINFLDHELKRLGQSYSNTNGYCKGVIDTLLLARKKHRGQKNNLDALCKRYGIDNTNRTLHGALLDAQILADVYLAMTGGQVSLFELSDDTTKKTVTREKLATSTINYNKHLSVLYATEEENQTHLAYLQRIKDKSGECVWLDLETKQ